MRMLGLREDFFRRGFMRAVLKSGGTEPEERESFRTRVIVGRRESRCSYRRGVGRGSRSQEALVDSVISFRTTVSDTGGKRQSGIPVKATDSSELSAGDENPLRMVKIFWVK